MEKYIYRVLNDMDESSSGICCKKYIDYDFYTALLDTEYTFGEALDNITSHIIKGNTANSVWISCSKNFNILRLFPTTLTNKRPFFAIIKNHSQYTPDIFNYYKWLLQLYGINDFEQYKMLVRSTKLEKITKMVFDFSQGPDILYQSLINSGIIYKKDGKLKQQTCNRETGYASKCQEVLVLRQISSNDCIKLHPLQYDVLYALKRNDSVKEIDENILNILVNNLKIPFINVIQNTDEDAIWILNELSSPLKNFYETLNEAEKFVFTEIYIKRTPVSTLCETKDQSSFVFKIQKEILLKIIEMLNNNRLTGFHTVDIKTIEEEKSYMKTL